MSKMIRRNWPLLLEGLILTGCIYLVVVKPLLAEPIDTHHSSWHVIRANAAEDDTTFAAALALQTDEGNFANKPSGAFHIVSGDVPGRGEGYSPGSKWMFALCGTHEDGDVFSFNVVGWAKTNGMAQVICEGDGVLGKQDVVIQPDGTADANGFWADTINLEAQTKWPGTQDANGFVNSSGIGVYNSGNDEVAILVIETTGLEWIQFIVYDATGGAQCATVTVYGRRW